MKIVVTGAAGHLGAPVCRRLAADGHEVCGADQRYRGDLPGRFEVVDLLDPIACYRLLQGGDALVHLANHSSLKWAGPLTVFTENMRMNANMFQAAADLGVKRVIFASSIQVIDGAPAAGEQIVLPAYLPLDGDAPAHPDNLYALSKSLSEHLLAYHALRTPLTGIAIRFPGISHPRMLAPDSTTWIDPRQAERLRDAFALLHIEDAVSLVSALVAADLPAGFRRYLPASPGDLMGMSAQDVIRTYFPAVPLRQPIEQIERLVDPTALERDTGWKSCTPVHQRLHPSPRRN